MAIRLGSRLELRNESLVEGDHFRGLANAQGPAGPQAFGGTSGPDHLVGTPGDDVLDGLGGDDIIEGLAGNDSLEGGTGADSLIGGLGDDTYYLDNLGDSVSEAAGEGFDTVYVTINRTLTAGADIEVLAVRDPATTTAIDLIGNAVSQEIIGNNGINTLRGQGGTDTFRGLAGNDTYFVDSADDVVDETAGNGFDSVYASVNYTLAAGVDIEILRANGLNLTLTGNALSQSLFGGNGNDILDGGGGADGMIGGLGDDTYYVDADDVVIEGTGQGNDTVYANASYQLIASQDLELLAARDPASTATISLSGNTVANTIRGNAGANLINGGEGADQLEGLGGDDRYIVDDSADVVVEASGQGFDIVYTVANYTLGAGNSVEVLSALDSSTSFALNLTGNELDNGVHGNNGANILDGGGGIDRMVGFAGDDIYIVDDAADIAVETAGAGQGSDTIRAKVNYVLDPGNSIETLIAFDLTGALNLTGNDLANRVEGNNGANLLSGGFLGLSGTDTLVGHGGDDRYILDSQLDAVLEADGEGYDIVYTTASYILNNGNAVEVLSALDSTTTNSMNLQGNEFANWIHGNDGANTLSGGQLEISGIDRLVGFGGDDRYIVDDSADVVVEVGGQGFDYLYTIASYTLGSGLDVEVLSALDSASTNPMTLIGNEIANGVYGNNGANTIDGGAGADRLAGFGNADTFQFTTALGGGNVDTIVDFNVADDTIALDDAVFTGLTPGALPAGAFVIGSGAGDADDRIIYNSATGQLLYDADGIGGVAAVQFADMSAGLALTASDFVVI